MTPLIALLLLSSSPALINGDRLLFQVTSRSHLPDGEVCVMRTLRYLSFDEAQRYAPFTAEEWEGMRRVAHEVHHFVIVVDRSRA